MFAYLKSLFEIMWDFVNSIYTQFLLWQQPNSKCVFNTKKKIYCFTGVWEIWKTKIKIYTSI